jgi:Bacterial Ig-like domain (group 2)
MKSNRLQVVATFFLAPILCVLIAAGCGSGAAKLKMITVTPAKASIALNATQQFKATGTYTDGSTADITATVTWSSGTMSVATIGASTGLATGVAGGTSLITATSGKVSGTANLTVATLASIAVTPNPASVGIGGTVQFTATGTFSDSSTANISSQVTWKSATPAVATISAAGLATGVTLGTSNITATLGAIVSPVDVLTVTPPTLQSITVNPANPTIALGATVGFTATGKYTDGSSAPLSSVTWASGTMGTATILANGIAVSQATGTSTITATLNGVNGTTLLTVQPAFARSAYVSGPSDSNTAIYVLKTSPAAVLPIASASRPNTPVQAVPEPSGRFAYLLASNVIYTATVDPVSVSLSTTR